MTVAEVIDVTMPPAVKVIEVGNLGGGGGGGGGSYSSPYVPVVIFNGESNSGGMAYNSQALPTELGDRPSVQIFDNIGLTRFETLNIPGNNILGHYMIPSNGTYHGWELGLANSVSNGQWLDDTVYLIKTGQGASVIAEWDVGHASGYWQKFLDRTSAALNLLHAQGKVPLIYFWWTLGLNDASSGQPNPTPIGTWQPKVVAFFARVRAVLGYVPIFIPTYMAGAGMPQSYFDALHQMAADDNMIQIIDSTGATVIQPPAPENTYHWDYAGMKTLADRLGTASRTFGQHEGYNTRRIDRLSGSSAVTTPPPVTPGSPVNSALPTISGATTLGAVLTATTGTWTNTPTSYGYQWKRNGAVIAGATATTHTIVTADQATTITCTVTATNADGSTPATSAGLAIPAAAAVTAPVTWTALSAGVTAPGNGQITCTTATGGDVNGAVSSIPINVQKDGWEVIVLFESATVTDAVTVFIDDDNTGPPYTWGSAAGIIGVYQHLGTWFGPTYGNDPTQLNPQTPVTTYPFRIKMSKSGAPYGDYVLYSYGPGASGPFDAAWTSRANVLAGKTTGYIKAYFPLPAVGQTVTVWTTQ